MSYAGEKNQQESNAKQIFQNYRTALQLVEDDFDIAMENFTATIKSDETRKKYVYAINTYLEFLQIRDKKEELGLLLKADPKDIEKTVIAYIMKLRKEEYSYATIMTRVAGILSFFVMNDIVLNKRKVSKFMGEHIKTIKDRAYTLDEIKQILKACNSKYKVIVSLMTATGCRIGSISPLKVKDLKYFKKYRLHQVFFYTNTKEEYYSFTTPECSNYIFEYLDYRARCGEQINPDSPLIRNDFQQDDTIRIQRPKPQTKYNFEFYLYQTLIKTGLRNPVKQDYRGSKKRMRTEVSANHGFRKFVHTTMTHAKILPEVREMLLGHSIGLSGAYYKPSEHEMLTEYLKVVNDLTINDENRLKLENAELKNKYNNELNDMLSEWRDFKQKMGWE